MQASEQALIIDFSQAQQDAANMIVQAKLRANPENAVGVLTMAE